MQFLVNALLANECRLRNYFNGSVIERYDRVIGLNEGPKMSVNVQPIAAHEVEPWLLKKHYAKRVPSVAYAYGLYVENELRGVVTYGIPANNNLNVVAGFPCLELNRLCVEDDAPKNSSSTLVGRSLKMVPAPTVVVSYADRDQGHVGYIYQATNWIYTGMGAGDVEFEKDGKRSHRKALFNIFGTGSRAVLEANGYVAVPVTAKHRYVYFVGTKRQKKEMAAALSWQTMPYPKGETSQDTMRAMPCLASRFFLPLTQKQGLHGRKRRASLPQSNQQTTIDRQTCSPLPHSYCGSNNRAFR